MALGTHGDIVTFTPPAGSPAAGVLQTGIVIGFTGTTNRVAYSLGIKADQIKYAHEAVTTSVTVLGNQAKHNG